MTPLGLPSDDIVERPAEVVGAALGDPPPESPQAIRARVDPKVRAGGVALLALLVWSVWGQWERIAILILIEVAHALVGTFLRPCGASCARRRRVEVLLAMLHGGLAIASGHVAGWTLPAWLSLPFYIFAANSQQAHEVRSLAASFLGVTCLVAFAEGAPALTVVSFAVLAIVLYALWEARAGLLREALARLREERERLAVTQKRLAQQEKMSSLGLLAAGIAHEINNPMSYVRSNVNALARDLSELQSRPELLREYVEEILPATLDGIGRVTSIVSDLQRFSYPGLGRPEPFDLNAEVEVALRMAKSHFGGGRRVEVALGALPRILGHAREIMRVVMNLLVNASHAIGPKGVVRIRTGSAEGGVFLEVRDDGAGMTAETRARLFEPFFTTKPVGQGTGLGLAIVHGIVAAHGGRIDVESRVGEGSTFRVWLPGDGGADHLRMAAEELSR